MNFGVGIYGTYVEIMEVWIVGGIWIGFCLFEAL